MTGRILSDDDSEILRQLNIDPNTLGVSTETIVRVEDDALFMPIRGIPSGGKLYRTQNGLPITIKGMPYKVEDAIALHAMKDEENHEVIDDVFRKRVKGVAPEDLLEMDRKYILGWMRDQTFQRAPLRRSFSCGKCGKVNLHRIISISNFISYNLPDGVSEPEFDLPVTLQRVKLRFERRRDVIRVREYVKSFEGFRKITEDDVKRFRIASVIEGKSLESALEFMASLDVIDYSILKTKFDECNLGMTDIAAIQCDNEKEECDHINLVHIPFLGDYYLPRLRPDMVDQGESIAV